MEQETPWANGKVLKMYQKEFTKNRLLFCSCFLKPFVEMKTDTPTWRSSFIFKITQKNLFDSLIFY